MPLLSDKQVQELLDNWWPTHDHKSAAYVPRNKAVGRLLSLGEDRQERIERERKLLEALLLAKEALAPAGHFQYAADRNVAIGDAYNAIQKALADLEEKV